MTSILTDWFFACPTVPRFSREHLANASSSQAKCKTPRRPALCTRLIRSQCAGLRGESKIACLALYFISMPRKSIGGPAVPRVPWFLAASKHLSFFVKDAWPGQKQRRSRTGSTCRSGSRRRMSLGRFLALHSRPISRRQELGSQRLLPEGPSPSGFFNDLVEQTDEFRRPQGRRSKTLQSVEHGREPPATILDRMHVKDACASARQCFGQGRYGVVPRRDGAEDQCIGSGFEQPFGFVVGSRKCATATAFFQFSHHRGKTAWSFNDQKNIQFLFVHIRHPSPSRQLHLGDPDPSGFASRLGITMLPWSEL